MEQNAITGRNTKALNMRYLRNKVETASQGELILMLYDGALKFLNLAKQAIAENNYETKDESLDRVEGIISELLNGLDAERGGEVANSLKSLYVFFLRHLHEAKFGNHLQPIDDVQEMLGELRIAWTEIIRKTGSPVTNTSTEVTSARLPKLAI